MKLTARQAWYYLKSKAISARKLGLVIQRLPLLQLCIGLTLGCILGVVFGVVTVLGISLLTIVLRKRQLLIMLSAIVAISYCAINGLTIGAVLNYQLPEASITASVVEEPISKSFGDSIVIEKQDRKRFLLSAPRYSGYRVGDVIELTVDKFENLSSQDPQYAVYLSSKGIYGEVSSTDIKLIENHSDLSTQMSILKRDLSGLIKHNLLPPESDLLEGILVGEKASLSNEFKEDLQTSGLMHVISVSGFNMMLIANFLIILCGTIPRKLVYCVVIVLVWLFLFVVGIENLPAQRAVVMLAIMYGGLLIGRRLPMMLCLIYASTLMIIMNPLVWLNISWQLSFAAMLGVVIFSSILIKFFQTESEIGSNFTTTLAVILTTGPISFISFGSFSLVGLISNLIIVPLVPIITLLGLISIAGNILQNLANILFQVVELILRITVVVIKALGDLTVGVVNDPRLALAVMILLCTIILVTDFKIFVRSVENQYAQV